MALHMLCPIVTATCQPGCQRVLRPPESWELLRQVPEPFQLAGDALHQHAEAAKQQYLEEEEQKRKAQAAFKVGIALFYDVPAVQGSS